MKTQLFSRLLMTTISVFSFNSLANSPPMEVDNSAVNVRDRGGKSLTAQDQVKGSMTDVELTRVTRQRLVRDENLSTNAKNVKIITLDKVMTLRGPVGSPAEKMRILDHARSVSSSLQIIDNLEVKR